MTREDQENIKIYEIRLDNPAIKPIIGSLEQMAENPPKNYCVVKNLLCGVINKYYDEEISKENSKLLIIGPSSDQPCGYALFSEREEPLSENLKRKIKKGRGICIELMDSFLRGKGFCKAMTEHLKKKNPEFIELMAADDNSYYFFEHLGFKQAGITNSDMYIMTWIKSEELFL